MEFVCRCCGETHEGRPDLGFEFPDYYLGIAEDERELRCSVSSDLCTIDGKYYFVRGCLEIPILGLAELFVYGVWSSLSEASYREYAEAFDQGRQSQLGPYFGWLSSRLPGYPETLNLKVRVQPRDDGARPRFELEPTDHPLSIEQRNGISEERLQEIYEGQLHPSPAP